MSIPFDLHMHSAFSSDSDASTESMVRHAIELQLQSICLTEHVDYDYPPNDENLTFLVDLDAYVRELRRLQTAYAGQIEILTGLELGMQPHLTQRYGELAGACSFDYLAASQHLVDGLDPYDRSFWEGRSEAAVYRQYFTEMYDNLQRMIAYEEETGKKVFDTVAHLDYIVRYGPNQNHYFSFSAYKDVIEPILALLISHEKCLEINTAGLKYGLGQTHPAKDILQRYYAMGGRLITLGSDAHKPEHMAWAFPAAAQMLLSLGFKTAVIFRQRKPYEVPLKNFFTQNR